MNYCLPVFGNVFGLDKYRDTTTRYSSYTKEDNRKLQVLQNTVMRLLTGSSRGTPTTDLLKLTNTLSVQQLVAFHTLVMVFKIITTSRPAYLARKLKVSTQEVLQRCQGTIIPARQSLSITRGGFIFRGTQLYNSLPQALRKEKNLKKYRDAVRTWVQENILARPN